MMAASGQGGAQAAARHAGRGGRAHWCSARGSGFTSTRLPFREDCLSHETYPEPVELAMGTGPRCRALGGRAGSPEDLCGWSWTGAGRGGRLPALVLRRRGTAVAVGGSARRGGLSPELQQSPAVPSLQRAIDGFLLLPASGFAASDSLRYIVRVDGPADSGFFPCWPRPWRSCDRHGESAGERRRDRLRRDERPRARAAARPTGTESFCWPTRSRPVDLPISLLDAGAVQSNDTP